MQQRIYTVYDSKAEAYMKPFFTTTKGLALRSFVDEANKPGTSLNTYPSDYTLFEIGMYDEQKGIITMHKAHETLGTALEHIRPNQDNPVRNPGLESLSTAPITQEENQKAQ